MNEKHQTVIRRDFRDCSNSIDKNDFLGKISIPRLNSPEVILLLLFCNKNIVRVPRLFLLFTQMSEQSHRRKTNKREQLEIMITDQMLFRLKTIRFL